MDFLKYLTDQYIMGAIQTIKTQYAITGTLFVILVGTPILYVLKKIAALTPWKSDDRLFDEAQKRIDALEKRVGIMPPQ